MTNILPQAAGFNQNGGAWLYTEELIECSRDLSDVKKQVIFGGALFYDDSNDYFLDSHGIPTPEEFWKVVVRYYKDGRTPEVNAWVMLNYYATSDDDMGLYEKSIAEIKSKTGDAMTELPSTYNEVSTWSVPSGCDKSRRV